MNDAIIFPKPIVDIQESDGKATVRAYGEWTIQNCVSVDTQLKKYLPGSEIQSVTIDLKGVGEIDTSGAWLVTRLRSRLREKGLSVELVCPNHTAEKLIEKVESHIPEHPAEEKNRFSIVDMLEAIGVHTAVVANDYKTGLNILGALLSIFVSWLKNPKKMRIYSIATHFYKMGIGAVPIVALISFLTGAILSQQGGYYLKLFGADIFIVNLTGILVFRELGLILTAIMIAGRSGSAFTAEIGSMKMREEIDALKTIGMSQVEVLILPRMIALVIAMPILTFFADLSAVLGGILVSWVYLDITPQVFLYQLQQVVTLKIIMVGIVKAPVMAVIIALIAAIEGIKVQGSTDSLGRHTTQSVVKAIFMVIVVDGLFAMFFVTIGV